MKTERNIIFACGMAVLLGASCATSPRSAGGGEVTGVSATSWAEPTPYGMVLINRGSIDMGPQKADSAWNIKADARGVSVDGFWMDETEITNSKYKQFVFWVRDSIIRERLADPAYGGNEDFKIEEDREGNTMAQSQRGRAARHRESLPHQSHHRRPRTRRRPAQLPL